MKLFLRKLFGREEPLQGAPPTQRYDQYSKGDLIGPNFQVLGVLGKGGFGIVYLARNRDSREICALKTFRDELLADAGTRAAFKREVDLWRDLEDYPFILSVRWAAEIYGRLFVQMDYVAPDSRGCVNLADHLNHASANNDANRSLEWALQFCAGMEHANAHGVGCHRDIKPANILITNKGTLKISDFGLAAAAEVALRGPSGWIDSSVTGPTEHGFAVSAIRNDGKVRCGTPGYIAPEVYRCETADVRSDIYSFGLVLWQMATGSRVPPFAVPWQGEMEEYLRATYELQMSGQVPSAPGPLGSTIVRCLQPDPCARYRSFQELREDLEPIWTARTGKRFKVSRLHSETAATWNNKGGSLHALGRYEEAIECFNRALGIDPRNANSWNGKGVALCSSGQNATALECFDKALTIEPRNSMAWENKGNAFAGLGRQEEAIRCYDKALSINGRSAYAWHNKGESLLMLRRYDEAFHCFDKSLLIDPRNLGAWHDKAMILREIGRHQEALTCYDQALKIDPLNPKVLSQDKGFTLNAAGQYELAIECWDKALKSDPRFPSAWLAKGNALLSLGRLPEAVACYDKEITMDPRHIRALSNKGVVLGALGRHEEQLACYDKVLAVDPKYLDAWFNRGGALFTLNRYGEAMACFEKALAISPEDPGGYYGKAQCERALARGIDEMRSIRNFLRLASREHGPQVAQAKQRLQELELGKG